MRLIFVLMAMMFARSVWAQSPDANLMVGMNYDKLSAWQRSSYLPKQKINVVPRQDGANSLNHYPSKISLRQYGTAGYWRAPLAYPNITTSNYPYPFPYPVSNPKQYYLYPTSPYQYDGYPDPYSYSIAQTANFILNHLLK
jgi:hypothetical protein